MKRIHCFCSSRGIFQCVNLGLYLTVFLVFTICHFMWETKKAFSLQALLSWECFFCFPSLHKVNKVLQRWYVHSFYSLTAFVIFEIKCNSISKLFYLIIVYRIFLKDKFSWRHANIISRSYHFPQLFLHVKLIYYLLYLECKQQHSQPLICTVGYQWTSQKSGHAILLMTRRRAWLSPSFKYFYKNPL